MRVLVSIIPILFSMHAFSSAEHTGKITKLLVHHNVSSSSDDAQRFVVRLEEDISGGLCSDKTYLQGV